MADYRLIAAEASYYSGKVRAYLRYKGIPFEEILATRKLYQELPVFQRGVRSIPVLLTPEGDAVTDSTDIIDLLEGRFPEPAVCPPTPLQRLVALLFEIYADEWLLIPAMHYRWSYREENYDTVVREFGTTLLPDASPDEQRRAGEKAAAVFDPVLPMLGITERTRPAIEAWYEEFLDQMSAHLAVHPFLLGSRPSLGDFALMGPLYAQLYRDPYPGRLMRARAPRVAAWVERMNALTSGAGAFVPDDAIPPTTVVMMKRIFCEQLPVLGDTARRLGEWIDANPDAPLPRGIGFHSFMLGQVTERRVVVPYSVSMLQRVIDLRGSLGPEARVRVDEFLRAQGGENVVCLDPGYRIRRVKHTLAIDRCPPS